MSEIAGISGHALFVGEVGHQRLSPKKHQLNYPIQYFWLELTAPDSIPEPLCRGNFGAFRFRRHDYLQNRPDLAAMDLAAACHQCATELGAALLGNEQVFLLSPLANWGRYFSPLTQYYFYRDGQPVYLLAEVSNTPWNERHHYLVPLQNGASTYWHAKDFHVSPFNQLDMQYRWQVRNQPAQLQLVIENYQHDEKIFSAWYRLSRQPLTRRSLRQALIRQPWQNVQVIMRIYWHALLLLLKGVPFVPYQKSKDAQL